MMQAKQLAWAIFALILIGLSIIAAKGTAWAGRCARPSEESISPTELYLPIPAPSLPVLDELPKIGQTTAERGFVDSEASYSHSRQMNVSAYCGCSRCCGKWSDGITASGQPITANGGKFVAADRSIPFGTMIFVPGYHNKPVPVLDRGSVIKGDKLDVFFADDPGSSCSGHQQALNWGRRKLVVKFQEPE